MCQQLGVGRDPPAPRFRHHWFRHMVWNYFTTNLDIFLEQTQIRYALLFTFELFQSFFFGKVSLRKNVNLSIFSVSI